MAAERRRRVVRAIRLARRMSNEPLKVGGESAVGAGL
jgi:hypothetical protein